MCVPTFFSCERTLQCTVVPLCLFIDSRNSARAICVCIVLFCFAYDAVQSVFCLSAQHTFGRHFGARVFKYTQWTSGKFVVSVWQWRHQHTNWICMDNFICIYFFFVNESKTIDGMRTASFFVSFRSDDIESSRLWSSHGIF